MNSTHSVQVPLAPQLSASAQHGHVLNGLKTGSLISIGQLCDDDCAAIFTKFNVKIIKDGNIIITGNRDPQNGLWNIPLAPKPFLPTSDKNVKFLASSAISDDITKQDLAAFLHGTIFSPSPSTLIRAIKKNHFTSWPGLTESIIRKHLPKSIATSKGHLRGQQKNIKSTKADLDSIPMSTSLDLAPSQEPSNPKTNNLFLALLTTDSICKSFSDQTGQFPVQSGRGNNYIFILYDYDSNAILSTAIPNRRSKTLTTAWTATFTKLQSNGYAPDLHILDNECSSDLKAAFTKYKIDFQRVPPHSHRRNAAERAIQTFKNHFVAGLCSCDPNFPLSEWDRLLPQCDITLNHLRSSRRQPKLSAHACLFGNFDFNKTPLAVPGTKVIVHETPSQRRTFAPHGVEGYYVGPPLNTYRCYKTWIPATNSIRDAMTIDWFPSTIPFPKVSHDTYLRQTAEDMLSLLQQKEKHPLHQLTYGSTITNAYIQIAQILKRATARPTPAPSTTPPAIEPRVPVPQPVPQPTPAPSPTLNPTPISPTPAREPRVQAPSPPPPAVPLTAPVPAAPPQTSRRPAKCTAPYPPIHHQAPTHRKTYKRPVRPPLPNRHTQSLTTRYGPATRHLAQTAITTMYSHHIAALTTEPITPSGKQASLKTLLKGPDADRWNKGNANEFGRLLEHGIGKNRPANERIKGTGTLFPIRKNLIPDGRKVTYANFICNIRLQKEETHRVRMTAGGDKLDYPGDASSPTVSILDAKIHLNSTISDAKNGARYLGLDIKNFYLGTPMSYYQYLRVHRSLIPDEVMDEYNFTIESDGYVYFEVRRGMYGLKEAGIIAFQQLVAKLAPYGYSPMKYTPGLWKHNTRKTTFALCVDDFGVKYFCKDDALHLINAVKDNYEVTIDWEGKLYCGLNLDWHYTASTPYVDVSMNNYNRRNLEKFGHKPPAKPQHAPHSWTAPVYGRKTAQKPTISTPSPSLDSKGTKRVQSIAGTYTYYSEVDPCIKVALNEIASQQAKPTEATVKTVDWMLDYLSTHPDATLRFYASDMILIIETDAAYLVLPNARSRAAAWFIFGNDPKKVTNPMTNSPVHVMCNTIKNVVSSAAEAETGGVYLAAQRAVPMRLAAIELGHPQPENGSPLYTDNSTAAGILKSEMRQKLSKAFDMRFYWVKDRIKQKQFDLIWRKGVLNMADYFTKHHPPWHHKKMRYKYLHKPATALLALCAKSVREGVLLPAALPY